MATAKELYSHHKPTVERLRALTPVETAFHAQDATNSLAFLGGSSRSSPAQASPGQTSPAHLSRSARAVYDDDSSGALSGYGYGHHGHNDYCPEGVPIEQALFAILAAFAASFGFLYRAITLITQGRRKKRSAEGASEETLSQTLTDRAADLYWWGM